MRSVNLARGLDPPPPSRKLNQHLWLWIGTCSRRMRNACAYFSTLSSWLQMTSEAHDKRLDIAREQREARVVALDAELSNDTLPWTIDTAFYAISGAIVLVDGSGTDLAITTHGFRHLAEHEPRSLIPLQCAALQDPTKATGFTKAITCAQALWFCSQCIARLSQDMAISLIELNTFAHCISAFFIYAFWWHKPYDVETHVYIRSPELLYQHSFAEATSGTRFLKYGNHHEDFQIRERDSSGQWITGGTVRLESYTPILSPTPEEYPHLYWPPGHPDSKPDRYPHKIKPGYPIPDTDFVISYKDPHPLRSPEVHASEHALSCWKRLWEVRLDNKFDMQATEAQDTERTTRPRITNLDATILAIVRDNIKIAPVVALAAFLYGGTHLLAWRYNFQTNTEGVMWRIASIITASSGLVFLPPVVAFKPPLFFLISFIVLARSFLTIESFRALPNSPSSVYETPRWSAYLPHF
jgi:hypothetical protein